jgi:ubiquinone/menaquinone biosynthesis C-methylase UbiE
MSFDVNAVKRAYAAGAADYAAKFGDELSTNNFDRSFVEHALEGLRAPSLILDAGCGPAQVSALVRSLGHRAVGLDLTPEMLTLARQRQAADAFVCADLRFLPLAAASFDAVVCRYSLHNLPRPLIPLALAELRRTLRADGRLLIATHGGTGDEWHETAQADGDIERVVVTYYAPDELHDLVRAAGFEAVQLGQRDPLPHEHQVRKLYVSATAT